MSRGRVDDDLWWWKNRISKRIEPPKKWQSIQTTNFFTENKKKSLFSKYIFWVIWVLKHILNIDFFAFFSKIFRNFFEIFKFQTPLAAKLCESSPQFFLILTQCIPYYQSGMVSMSRGRVDDELWWWKNRISKRIEPPKKWLSPNYQLFHWKRKKKSLFLNMFFGLFGS